MADHPEFADRMAQRWGKMSPQQEQMSARGPVARFQSLQDGKTLVGKPENPTPERYSTCCRRLWISLGQSFSTCSSRLQ